MRINPPIITPINTNTLTTDIKTAIPGSILLDVSSIFSTNGSLLKLDNKYRHREFPFHVEPSHLFVIISLLFK